MTWNVTYRGNDGKPIVEVYEADSREALFKTLSDKGVNAIRIEEARIGNQRKFRTTKGSAKSAVRRAAVWGCIGIATAITAYFVVNRKQDNALGTTPVNKKQAVITEVKPATTAPSPRQLTNTVGEVEDRNSLEWLKKHDKRYIVPEDAVRRPNGRLYTKDGRRILEKLPARTIHADAGRKRVFEHQAEREIARLLSIEPGKFFIGNANYGPRFRQSFAEAVANPTPILEDDDEETISLKKQVNEVKADLAQRLKDGEDIVQIMKDTEKELRTLATFRNDMMKELTALRFDESVTEQDYKDFVEAANRMLKERGLKELSSPVFAEAQLKYIREVHKAKQAAKAAREATTQQSN